MVYNIPVSIKNPAYTTWNKAVRTRCREKKIKSRKSDIQTDHRKTKEKVNQRMTFDYKRYLSCGRERKWEMLLAIKETDKEQGMLRKKRDRKVERELKNKNK